VELGEFPEQLASSFVIRGRRLDFDFDNLVAA
jgi:hypothetical protein